MFQRFTRSFAAPLALLLGSIAAPPSRADFILYIANGGQANQPYPPDVKVTSDHQYTEWGFNSSGTGGFNDYGLAVDSSSQRLFIDENSWVYQKDLNFNTQDHWASSGGWAMAVGPKGNLFVSADGQGINEITPGSSTVTNITTNYQDAFGMALDSAGNLYVTNGNQVDELDKTTSYKTVVRTYSQASAWGLAIDPANGNLFVGTDSYDGGVREFDTTTGLLVNTFTGYTRPRGLAFDAGGDLFVGDQGDGTIYEISDANVLAGISTKSTFASGHGISAPDQLAIFEPQTPAVTAEPSSLTLLSLGLASLAATRWRRRRSG